MKKFVLCVIIIFHCPFFILNSFGQDSSRLQISLLTCSPGEELYSTFGHSAFRIVDSSKVNFNGSFDDVVYNYGTFYFDEPGFYMKFMRGKLNYYLSTDNFQNFVASYQQEKRGIIEQVLNLTGEEKLRIKNFLAKNMEPQNRAYKYDFFFDNCTSRLKDIIKREKDSSFCKRPVMPVGTTFREAIHHYLRSGKKYWSELAIDILLGEPCDAQMTPEQMHFLPDMLMMSLDDHDHEHSDNRLILSEKKLYDYTPEKNNNVIFTPWAVFSLILGIVVVLSLMKNYRVKYILNSVDSIFFFLVGLLGIILVLMWFGTDHIMTKKNFNLLWALPTHAIVAFFVGSNKKWVRVYFGFTAALMILLLVSWSFLPQQLNMGLIPVVLLLLLRSAMRYVKTSSQVNTD